MINLNKKTCETVSVNVLVYIQKDSDVGFPKNSKKEKLTQHIMFPS